MVSPKFIEQKPVPLSDVHEIIKHIEKRDQQLGHTTTKVKEYVDLFTPLSSEKKEQLLKKLAGLDVTRLKEEHITKILDFLPQTPNDVKIIFQGYNVSLAKKDQESIAATVKEIVS
ncbi:TPA: hypothetical protein HA241_00080 [Candidatus Woesearchaeota archaeon]|nr:hypothetical protein [Candidatus Woesearchaeota archaeon]